MVGIYFYFRRGLCRQVLLVWRSFVLLTAKIVPAHPCYRPLQDIRNCILRLIGIRIGKGSNISEHFFIYDLGKLTLGERVRLGAFCQIHNISPIDIGDNLLASHNLIMISGTHSTHDLSAIAGPIVIGKNVWIGANVTIIGPVVIGDNSIIGACSLIIKDVPPNVVVAGNPARIIKHRE